MTKEALLIEIAMLREIIQEQNQHIDFLENKLHSIELYIAEYERKCYQ